MKMEKQVLELAKQNGFKCTIARPSVVSGRLLDYPKYITNSYIVFYAIGAFFSKMKALYKEVGRVRILMNPEGGLNIVPVDYVARAILRAADTEQTQLNITHTKSVSIKYLLTQMFKKCGIEGLEFVSEEPKDKSTVEALFYKTIGNQLASYSISKKHEFESKLVRDLLHDVEEPDVTSVFKDLYDFAHNINFDNNNVYYSNHYGYDWKSIDISPITTNTILTFFHFLWICNFHIFIQKDFFVYFLCWFCNMFVYKFIATFTKSF